MLLRRRSRRAAAVVGLVAGLALLLGAVLDGGMSTPTRSDLLDGASATVVDSHPIATLAPAREDHPAWGTTLPTSRIALLVAALTTLAVAATVITPTPAVGPRHRAPALLVARRRGPPSPV